MCVPLEFKESIQSLESELQMFMSSMWVLETEPTFSARNTSALITELSLQVIDNMRSQCHLIKENPQDHSFSDKYKSKQQ